MEFIEHFHQLHGNLFIYGDTGVGKTFLSHCIAKEMLQRGVSVLYISSYELFSLLADQTFSKEDSQSSITMESVCMADLVIIDDLGTELTNSFVKSQLFSIINERLLHRKSTIISTNYDMETFSNIYTTRVFSRIMQSYTLLNLIGQDIRVQKTLGGINT
jgi:DNA replication protein DnaC